MDYIQFLSEVVITIVKHGWSASTLIIFIFALFKFTPFRRFVMRNLPRKLRMLDNRMDSMDVRMKRMESKIDAIMSAGGVSWAADSTSGKSAPSGTTGRVMKSSSPQAVYVLAIITRLFTPLKAISLSPQRRMNMKSKLLSRKFLMALVSGILVVLNDGLNLGLDQNTIIAFCSIVVGYIVGEAATDVAKAKNTGFDDTKTH